MINKMLNFERKYYLDWLRIMVIILVIFHHTALTFSKIGKGYFYIDEQVKFIYYFIQSDFFNLWFMKLLFFISGMSIFMALRKKRNLRFVKERVLKLLIPTLFVSVFLGPISAYIGAINNKTYNKSIFYFFPHYFSNITKYLGWPQMWFCVYLFTFSIILIPFFNFMKNNNQIEKSFNKFLSKKNNIFLPIMVIVLFEMVFRPYSPGYQNLYSDWANFTVYISYFILGYIFAIDSVLSKILYEKRKIFLVFAILSSVTYIYLHYLEYYNLFDIKYYFHKVYCFKLFLSFLQGIASYSWIGFIIGISQKHLNKSHKKLPVISEWAFVLYVIHYVIVTSINCMFVKYGLKHYYIFILTSILTIVISIPLYKYIIKRFKLFRILCGLK
jgi:hypothetical protein